MNELKKTVHPADLIEKSVLRAKAPLILGIDPDIDRISEILKTNDLSNESAVHSIEKYFTELLPSLSNLIAGVKIQSACFERWGYVGIHLMSKLIKLCKDLNLLIILDHKRGDISISARHYAFSAKQLMSDWATVSPWLGNDSIEPYLVHNIGTFVLIRTSNDSGNLIQSMRLSTGETVSESLAKYISNLGSVSIGNCGYSSIGAVIGGNHTSEFITYRDLMPHSIFLLPGIGAQGGNINDLSPCFDTYGRGALVTSSRSILYPKDKTSDWIKDSVNVAHKFIGELDSIGVLR